MQKIYINQTASMFKAKFIDFLRIALTNPIINSNFKFLNGFENFYLKHFTWTTEVDYNIKNSSPQFIIKDLLLYDYFHVKKWKSSSFKNNENVLLCYCENLGGRSAGKFEKQFISRTS